MKYRPDIDLADIFDDIEDERRVNKHDHHFIPYEECCASNEFNPEIMFFKKEEEKEKDEFEDEERLFIIKSPAQQLEFFKPRHYPITLDTEEAFLELIPCNAKIKTNQPHQLGIGKIKQLKKLHYGHR